jgi:hypothetical protein
MIALVACGTTQRATRTDEGRKPFITESVIDVPEQARSAILVSFDRLGSAGEGVMARYRSPELGDAPVDLFVYPAGRMPAEQALQIGVEAFGASVRYAEQQGSYRDVVIKQPAPFAVAWDGGAPIPARKVALQMRDEGGVLLSRAWIAYKQNYWFKLRITVSPASAPVLDSAGDAIAGDLLARARAFSKGACADRTITLNAADLDDGATVADAILEAASRLEREGCAASDFPDPASGFRRTRLPFPPDAWDGEDGQG